MVFSGLQSLSPSVARLLGVYCTILLNSEARTIRHSRNYSDLLLSASSSRYAEFQKKAALKARAEEVRARMRDSHLAGFREEVKQRCVHEQPTKLHASSSDVLCSKLIRLYSTKDSLRQ